MNKKAFFLLIGILLVHILFVILSMSQPFHGDEVVFSESAKAILKTGKPVFDYSFKKNFQGLWHVPAYSYILALFILIFGKSIYVFRGVSVLFNFFTIILVYLISKEIFKGRRKEFFSLLAVLFYALNPFAIQSSIPLDIDAGLLNFSLYLFFYFFIKGKNVYWLIPSLLLVFLSKESGPVVLFVSLLAFHLIKKDFKELKKTILLFLTSGLLFLAVFFVYTSFFNLDFMMPFKHNFPFFREEVKFSFLNLARMAYSFKTFFYFAVPFFIALFFIFSFMFYYKIIKNGKELKQKQVSDVMLLNIFALITIFLFVYTSASAWGFPKYYITAMPAASIFAVYMLKNLNVKIKIDKNIIILFVLLSFLLTGYFLVLISEPLMPEFDSTAENINLIEAVVLIGKTFAFYVIFPFLICFFVFGLAKFKRKIFASLIFLMIFMFFYLNILHAVAPYSTYYNYGDAGVLDVVNYFKEKNISAGEIATYAHLGNYLGMPDYLEISWVYRNEKDFKEKVIENKEIEYMVIYYRDIGRIGENMGFFELEKKIGSYYVYRRK